MLGETMLGTYVAYGVICLLLLVFVVMFVRLIGHAIAAVSLSCGTSRTTVDRLRSAEEEYRSSAAVEQRRVSGAK